jgi:hypothetical protein
VCHRFLQFDSTNFPPIEQKLTTQHTPGWWRDFLQYSGLLDVEACYELEDAESIYHELVRYEYENTLDPFDVQICLDQLEWGHSHQPHKSLFVLSARKR